MAECIDKKAFKKSVEERYCKPCKADGKDHNGCWCRACWVDDMLDEVECFQPADVAPVGHGLWAPVNKIDPISGYRCSKCRRTHLSAYKVISGDGIDIYQFNSNTWKSTNRNLTFETGATASDEFRAWLASNATKQ